MSNQVNDLLYETIYEFVEAKHPYIPAHMVGKVCNQVFQDLVDDQPVGQQIAHLTDLYVDKLHHYV